MAEIVAPAITSGMSIVFFPFSRASPACSVRDSSRCSITTAISSSFQAQSALTMPSVTRGGPISGTTIDQRMRRCDAPSTNAAS